MTHFKDNFMLRTIPKGDDSSVTVVTGSCVSLILIFVVVVSVVVPSVITSVLVSVDEHVISPANKKVQLVNMIFYINLQMERNAKTQFPIISGNVSTDIQRIVHKIANQI